MTSWRSSTTVMAMSPGDRRQKLIIHRSSRQLLGDRLRVDASAASVSTWGGRQR